jgi:hypothetical protein
MAMNEPEAQKPSRSGGIHVHLLVEGIAALSVAVFHLTLLRGLRLWPLATFVAPPAIAFAIFHRGGTGPRRIALAFLILVAAGALVAPLPALFPKLGGVDRGLPVEADRLLTWYLAVYLLFITGVVPVWAFVSSIQLHRAGREAQLSSFTCYLGLATVAILFPGMLLIFAKHMGLWPVI